MKASLRSVRIAPKKAQLVAKMIRGKSVPDAMYILERTNKKSARLFEQLLRSAIANASHNDKQDAQMLTIKTLTVNKGQAYHRGVPMARGRVRPMRKFLSHIHLTLGVGVGEEDTNKKNPRKPKNPKNSKGDTSDSSASSDSSVSSKNASQTAKKPVKKTQNQSLRSGTGQASTKKTGTSSSGKSKKETAPKASKSSASKKSSS